MLCIDSLHSGYTAIDALRGVSLRVPERSIVGLLGPNGAGKTALMRALSGLNAVRSGSIQLDGVELAGTSPDRVVELGVVQVPQGRMLFGSMTVSDNLAMGAFLQRDRRAIARQLDLVHSMFPILHARASQPAAYLSGGEQQMLALGRALMAQPKFLLLDEPSLGLAPKVFDTILEQVQLIHAAGASVLIAEQNARKVLRIAGYCYLIEGGVIALEGPASQLARDPRIEQVYLGGHSHPLLT